MSKLMLFHDDMLDDYINNNKTLRYLSKKYGIQRKFISRYFTSIGVGIKKHGNIPKKTENYLNDKQWMQETYEKLNSLQKVADLLSVSKPTISKYLKKHNIPTNTKNYNKSKKINVSLEKPSIPVLKYKATKSSHKPRLEILQDREYVFNLYKKHRNIRILSDILNVSYPTIQNAIRYHNIPISCNNQSYQEQLLYSDIKTYYDGRIIRNTKNIVLEYELDIYIPDKEIAIELNGLKWHTEQFKDKMYHYNKWKACNDQGIQLIQIWEDEYNDPTKINKFIKYKLGFDNNKVFARKCEIIKVPNRKAMEFHNKYHIQSGNIASSSIGLVFDNKLVAVFTYKKRTSGIFELVRYSSSVNVVGGFTKLLKNFKRNIEFEELVTFADLCISNGNLYELSGFVKDKILQPDHKYVIDGQRVHKFNYRIKRFKNDENLLYSPELTGRELINLNNIDRIYDCGKIRYKYYNNE